MLRTALAGYLDVLLSGRRKPTPTGLRKAVRTVAALNRPALLHEHFSAWGQFGDEIDLAWREHPDPFLLARLSIAARTDDVTGLGARDLRVDADDLDRANGVWQLLQGATAGHTEVDAVLQRLRTGQPFPRWRDTYDIEGPLVVRFETLPPADPLPVQMWVDSLDLVRINVAIDGFVNAFSRGTAMRAWLAAHRAERLYVGVTVGEDPTESRCQLWAAPPPEKADLISLQGKSWTNPGTAFADVRLPGAAVAPLGTRVGEDEERARRALSLVMQQVRTASGSIQG